ncbi:hypothetical protein Y032_0137g2029 [Ancylostoma ceylanicum]|uniref:Uncharacterized protein n=1 Tax=Ancylostoma ceylanicum TaxID=53326 RepID=A0A016T489_9BILA|nr:hypothetical protein Y032_0137g2029 [Ancylostoma ceylanicum]
MLFFFFQADILITSPFLPPRDWSQVVRNPAVITPGSMPQRMPDQFVRQWPSILPLEAARPTNVHMRSRPRPMLPLSAQMITQTLPQYRSQQHVISADHSIPLLSGSSQSHEGPSRWPRSIYENHELLARENARTIQASLVPHFIIELDTNDI